MGSIPPAVRAQGGILGREVELASLDAFLEWVPAGPTAAVISGVPGIGKTTVWKAGVESAAARDYCILLCQPVQAETKLSFIGLTDLLADVSEETFAALPPPQRHALDFALLRVDPVGPPPDQRAVATAFLSVLSKLALLSPVIVGVDDVQWLDTPSSWVLEFAFRRLKEQPVGVLLSARVPDLPGIPLGLEAAMPESRWQQLQIGPLSLSAIYQLIATRLGLAFRRPLVSKIHQASGGNPFFALEIARALDSSGRFPGPGEPLSIPDTLQGLLAHRIAALPGPTKELLLVASAMSTPTVEGVRRATGEDSKLVSSILAKAEEAAIIFVEQGRIRFTHPLLAAAIYASAPPERRRTLHRVLADASIDVEERGRHLALGGKDPDQGVAAALDEAARFAAARGAPQTAAELFELARLRTPADRLLDARRRGIDAAENYMAAGDNARARALLEAVVDESSAGSARGEALGLLAELSHRDRGFAEGEELMREALSEVGGDLGRRAALQLDLLFSLVHTGGIDMQAARELGEAALRDAAKLEDPALLAMSWGVKATLDVLAGEGVDMEILERAIAFERAATHRIPIETRPSWALATFLSWLGRFDEARAAIEAMRQQALDHGEESDLPLILFIGVWIECWSGRLTEAARYADESHEVSVLLGGDWARGISLCSKATVHAYSGAADIARGEALESFELLGRAGLNSVRTWVISTLAFLELSLGDPAAVDRQVGPFANFVQAAKIGEPAVAFFLPDEIEALIALGALDRASPLLEYLEERGLALDRPWALATSARCRGLFLATQGRFDDASRSLESALEEHRRLPMPVELGRTLLVKGELHRRRKEKGAAQNALQAALDIFEQVGTRLWAERARAELARVGLRPSAPLDLTPTERRVAELAARGLTNQQVARAAFMSIRTVEANLTRAYRKLGIRSRAELGIRLAEEQPAAPDGT